MAGSPTSVVVACPECNSRTIAIIPGNSTSVADEERADGKVWANCRNCEESFLVYFEAEE